MRGLRHYLSTPSIYYYLSSKNWIDPFEGIETRTRKENSSVSQSTVRIELTRLRGLRPSKWQSNIIIYNLIVRIELTRLRGLRQNNLCPTMTILTNSSKNWIDPFEGIETKIKLDWDENFSPPRKNWIDPFEGIETLYLFYSVFDNIAIVRIELTRLRGLRLYPFSETISLPSLVRIELTRLRGLRPD